MEKYNPMEFFDHIYFPEQDIPALGIQTSGLLMELIKVQAGTQEFAFGKVLENLKSSYLDNEKKQQRVSQFIGM